MKKILLIILLFITANANAATLYKWSVYKVADGDTVEFNAPWLLPELGNHISVRIFGIDTPEKTAYAKCPTERAFGLKASEYTKKLIKEAKVIEVSVKGFDKYGGRILGNIYVDGKSIGDLLISNGLAKPYSGNKKPDWCKV